MLNHAGTQKLETGRLILRRLKMSDADDIYRNWVTDPDVCRFWQWEPHENIAETKCLLAAWIADYEKSDYYHWTIILKSISEAIGYIYLTDVDNENHTLRFITR